MNFFAEKADVPIVIESVIDAADMVQETSSRIKVVTPTPSRSNSIRNKTVNFRTFHSSTRRGKYTNNVPHVHPDAVHEIVPMVPPIKNHYDTEASAQSYEYFPPPPEEFYDAQSSPIQILADRHFDEEFHDPSSSNPSYNSDIPSLRTSKPLRYLVSNEFYLVPEFSNWLNFKCYRRGALNFQQERNEEVEARQKDETVELIAYRNVAT